MGDKARFLIWARSWQDWTPVDGALYPQQHPQSTVGLIERAPRCEQLIRHTFQGAQLSWLQKFA